METVQKRFLAAVERGDLQESRMLLQAHEGLVNEPLTESGKTALHVASQRGNIDICRLLLQFGANKSVDDEDKDTPVHKAARGGHVPILQLLKAEGCSLEDRNKYDNGPLVYASRLGHISAVQFLIENGVSLNERYERDRTALHMACSNRHSSVAEILISAGADVNERNDVGWTALFYASLNNLSSVAENLISTGADVNARNDHGDTALHYACQENHSSVAEILISAGADVNARNSSGEIPFDLASGSLQTTIQFAKLYSAGTVKLDCVKICFIGPPEAGKTTLCKAIRRGWLSSWISHDENAEETSRLEERTMGMDVFEADISSAGHMVLCDFAGHHHFHRTHSLFFDPSNTIYIMVVNGRLSKEQILAESRYWLAFLSASTPNGSRPVVVMVASRADVSPCDQLDRVMRYVSNTLRELFDEQLHIQERYFVLDCRKSQSTKMKEFRTFLGQIKGGLLKTQRRYPRVCEPILKMLPKLRMRKDNHLMELTDFVEFLKTEATPGIEDHFPGLHKLVVNFLHTTGEIFVVDDVVFLTIPWLSSYILGPVVEGLPQPTVKKDQLACVLKQFRPQHLPQIEVNVDHAVKALERLGVAFEVYGDPGVYCISAHLPEKDRQEVWQTQADTKMMYVGRRLECSRQTDIFTPGLFSFFQAKAAVCLDVLVQLYKGWMKMVKIYDHTVATECLVELSNHERAIDVVVRGRRGSELHCDSFLHTVMCSLDKLLMEKSPGTQLERQYLSPTHMKETKEFPAGFKEGDVESAAVRGPYAKVTCCTEGDIFTENVCDLFASASSFMLIHCNPVVKAVLKHGRNQWFSLGVNMGYRQAEINSMCQDKASDADKLLAMILDKSEQNGEEAVVTVLLEACKSIPSPIYGAVMQAACNAQQKQ